MLTFTPRQSVLVFMYFSRRPRTMNISSVVLTKDHARWRLSWKIKIRTRCRMMFNEEIELFWQECAVIISKYPVVIHVRNFKDFVFYKSYLLINFHLILYNFFLNSHVYLFWKFKFEVCVHETMTKSLLVDVQEFLKR